MSYPYQKYWYHIETLETLQDPSNDHINKFLRELKFKELRMFIHKKAPILCPVFHLHKHDLKKN